MKQYVCAGLQRAPLTKSKVIVLKNTHPINSTYRSDWVPIKSGDKV